MFFHFREQLIYESIILFFRPASTAHYYGLTARNLKSAAGRIASEQATGAIAATDVLYRQSCLRNG